MAAMGGWGAEKMQQGQLPLQQPVLRVAVHQVRVDTGRSPFSGGGGSRSERCAGECLANLLHRCVGGHRRRRGPGAAGRHVCGVSGASGTGQQPPSVVVVAQCGSMLCAAGADAVMKTITLGFRCGDRVVQLVT